VGGGAESAERRAIARPVSRPQSAIRAPQSEAEACFLKAIEITRRQQAKSLELRATVSLSRLWQQQGKRDEARQLFAPIYGWFTERFETKDCKRQRRSCKSWLNPRSVGVTSPHLHS
jgi:predicted ATPase